MLLVVVVDVDVVVVSLSPQLLSHFDLVVQSPLRGSMHEPNSLTQNPCDNCQTEQRFLNATSQALMKVVLINKMKCIRMQ